MNLLAIETATESCSVALLAGERLIQRSEIAPRRHAELLLPMCEQVLAEAGLARQALDAIAVGAGPGAFTGVRLGISAAQGLALALDLPVVPVSSLAALAMQAPTNGADVLAVIDARMGEIYAGCFRRDKAGLVVPLGPESVGSADALELSVGDGWNILGTGWTAYSEALADGLPRPPVWADGERWPQAADVAVLAAPAVRTGGGVPPEHALPVYLRDKVAQTLVERKVHHR